MSTPANVVTHAFITGMANIVGMMVVGSMIATTVKIKMPLEIAAGENVIVLQDMIDSVMPNLLGFIATFLVYIWLRRTQGKHTAFTIVFLIALAGYCHILWRTVTKHQQFLMPA